MHRRVRNTGLVTDGAPHHHSSNSTVEKMWSAAIDTALAEPNVLDAALALVVYNHQPLVRLAMGSTIDVQSVLEAVFEPAAVAAAVDEATALLRDGYRYTYYPERDASNVEELAGAHPGFSHSSINRALMRGYEANR